jgi:hypothetical protein
MPSFPAGGYKQPGRNGGIDQGGVAILQFIRNQFQ